METVAWPQEDQGGKSEQRVGEDAGRVGRVCGLLPIYLLKSAHVTTKSKGKGRG